jgi:hypothetical protein
MKPPTGNCRRRFCFTLAADSSAGVIVKSPAQAVSWLHSLNYTQYRQYQRSQYQDKDTNGSRPVIMPHKPISIGYGVKTDDGANAQVYVIHAKITP